MIRKIVGTIMTFVGGVLMVILLSGGGPILPHIIGPITLVVVGVILLISLRKNSKKIINE